MWCWRPPQIMPHQDNHKTVAPPYVIDTSDVVLAALLKISLSGLLCYEFLTTFMFHWYLCELPEVRVICRMSAL